MAETTANEIQNEITTTSTGVMARTGSAISELREWRANQPFREHYQLLQRF